MRSWFGKGLSLLFLMPALLGNAECNAFKGTAQQESDDALLYDAKKLIDQSEWTAALTKLGLMSTTKQTSHDGRVAFATAYAGRCGLSFVSFAKTIVDNISTQKLMQILLSSMKSSTSYLDCKSAETQLLAIPAGEMTSDDYVFLAFVEFAKLGTVLASVDNVDIDNDGTVDGGFNSCDGSAGNLVDLAIGEIGTAINIAVSSINSSGVSFAGDFASQYTSLCTAITTLNPALNFCGVTDATGFTAAQLQAIRTLVKANEVGLNTCGGASYSSAGCSCP